MLNKADLGAVSPAPPLETLSVSTTTGQGLAELNDWIFFDEKDAMHGGFTIKVVEDISRERADQKPESGGNASSSGG